MQLRSFPLSHLMGPLAMVPRDGEGAAAGGPASPSPELEAAGGAPSPAPAPGEAGGAAPAEPDAGAAATPEAPAGAAAPAAATPQSNGAAERIQGLTAEKWDAIRRAEAAEAEAEMQRRQTAAVMAAAQAAGITIPGVGGVPAAPWPAANVPTAADFQREVANAAAEMEYRRTCDDIIAKGTAAHGVGFQAALSNLSKYGPVPRALVEAAVETGMAPDVIHMLGNDPLEADRLLSLPPQRLGVAVAQLAQKITANKAATAAAANELSRAPAPITPRAGGAAPKAASLDNPDLPIGEWMALRNKTKKVA